MRFGYFRRPTTQAVIAQPAMVQASRTPYRHEATTRASTAPGRDSTVNSRNVATA